MLPRTPMRNFLSRFCTRVTRTKVADTAAEDLVNLPSAEESVKILQGCSSKKNPLNPYIIHDHVCEAVVKTLRDAGAFTDDVPLILGNPGLGHIAKAVLDAGAHKVIAMSDSKLWIKYLKSLQNKYGEQRLKTYWCNILAPSTLSPSFNFITDATGRHVPELKNPATEVPWATERPPFRLFGVFNSVMQETAYMARLLYTAPVGEGLYLSGRTECFLMISDWWWTVLSGSIADPTYTSLRMFPLLTKMFFDIQILEKFSRSSFYPVRPLAPKKANYTGDPDVIYLIRFRPAADAWSHCCKQEHAAGFLFYLRQLMFKRMRPILPIIEEWMPGSGIEMALLGYPVAAWIADLGVEDLIKIYRALERRPGFEATVLANGYHASESELDTEYVTELGEHAMS